VREIKKIPLLFDLPSYVEAEEQKETLGKTGPEIKLTPE
jgi:hypothetical protein